MSYLKLDLLILVVAVLWLILGIRVIQRVPLIHDPMVTFSRYHPRVAPLVLFLLVIFWPASKWVWKFVFFVADEVNKFKQGSKTK